MVKKKLKQKKSKGKRKKSKKRATTKKAPEIKGLVVEISQTQSDVKSFLEKFKADVGKKIKNYQQFARKYGKKKKP